MLQCPRCGRQFPDDVFVCPGDKMPLQADATIADVPLDPLLGRVFDGKYRLDERLGGGGMGTVYRATHLLIDRPVALKVLSQRFVGDQTAQQRFRREARAAGRMQHPNAVTVTDFGATDDGYLYIVMEVLEGRTLRDLLAHEAPLDPARAASFMLQACAAVGAAHDAGLIHRDLKPANIFIEQRPNFPAVVKVLDFGVAKFVVEEHDDDHTLTQVGTLIGTPRYMSPEQCADSATLTAATDVYSLGIILYEMLTGVCPFNGETPLAIALKQVSEAPHPPRELVASIPAALERVVLHSLMKNPGDRPRNANELRGELHATAEALGFEHAESTHSPMFETLRNAGTESPSGRLVIDLNTLRQVQAAVATAPVSEETQPLKTASPDVNQPVISRVNVPVERPPAKNSSVWLAGVILLIALLGSGVLAARWWRGDNTGIVAAATPTPTPTPTATPTATPTPVDEDRKQAHRKEQPHREQKSLGKKVLEKLKKAIPF
ncbi:MAG TPA: protein kinase [Pyrinomonadaceae bacterium]|nr:protein kinase [Pyrinomonadaceae bacterium]